MSATLAMAEATLAYYEAHAADFARETLAVDMGALYAPFLARVPAGGAILDAGCGAGRDARAFAELGYRVTAFDASPALVAQARALTGLAVECRRFYAVGWVGCFDGVWACASLLHVRAVALPAVLGRLMAALVPGGVCYVSFKYGEGERTHGGRHFTDLDEAGLAAVVAALAGVGLERVWVSGDRRPGRESERWLNALLRRELTGASGTTGTSGTMRESGSMGESR
jgi:SAM-dependent methyltransferase